MTTTSWTGAFDTDWQTAANWTNGVPDQDTDNVIVTGSNPITLSDTALGKNIDFTGFTGSFDPGGTGFAMRGNLTLSSGMTMVNSPGVIFYTAGSITSAGQSIRGLAIYENGVGTVTLNDDLTLTDINVQNANTLAMGDHTITFAATTSGGISIANGGLLTYTTGAKFVFGDGLALAAVSSTAALPPIEVGDSYVWIPGVDLTCDSWTQTGGTLEFYVADLTTVGNLSWTDVTLVTLSGNTCTVGGNFVADNTDLDGGIFDVTGTAVAHDAAINNCDFTAGTQLDASDNCTGAGNQNVLLGDFVPPARSRNRDDGDGHRRTSLGDYRTSPQGHWDSGAVE
jgi:hypothetical protein